MTRSPDSASSLAGRLPVLSSARWAHLLILALPFLAVILWWHGLTLTLAAFQGGDEPTHFEIIQTFAEQWPRPLFLYQAWSGPFVYWLLAGLTAPFGGSLVAGRLVVALFSWATCAIAYVLFRDRLHARPPDALALALLLAVSPFFFGQSFRVLTDNPTWFFVVLALERLLAYVQRPGTGRFAAFAACLAAATTMRHISLWLVIPALVALLSVSVPRRRRWTCLGLLVLALVPLLALMVYWGGLLPRAPGTGAAATPVVLDVRLRNLLLTLGIVGMYGVFMLPAGQVAAWFRHAREHLAWSAVLALPLIAAVGLLAAGALKPLPSFLALVSRVDTPMLADTGLLWWALVPIGSATTAALVATRLADVKNRLLVSALLGLLVSAMANPRWLERYVDFPSLLMLSALAIVAGVPLGWADRIRWLAAGLLAIAAFVLLL